MCTRWKNFASLFRFGSASTANVLDIRHKTVSPSKNVSSVVRTVHTKDAPKKKQNSPNVPTVQGHMVHLTRGVPNIKSRHLKSSMCRKVSNVAKTILGVSITGKELFESIGSLSASAPPRPFTFTSTKVNSGSKTTLKPSISKSTSPTSTSTKAVPKQPKVTN